MKIGNTKLLHRKDIAKILTTAFIMALLSISISFWIYDNSQNDIFPFNYLENDSQEDFEQIQWDFNSGLTLSNQLSEEINKLMFFKIDAGYRIKNPTGGYHYESVEGINYNVTEIEAWIFDDEVDIEMGRIGEIQRPVSGSWRMVIHSVSSNCPDDIFCHELIILNETENMNHLYSSFTNDISNIGNFINVTNNGTEEVSLLNADIEILYWAITHVYTDGSFMEFHIFNDMIIIRYSPLEVFLIQEGGVAYGPSINNTNSISFKAKIEGPILPNYTDGINSLLTSIVNR
ncbi:MAG: hypothetical protein ACXAD7_01565 [Candidatus Kariarchaeaceae archaeon]|jgi:hypothetical protein